jgi:hypothetical protein
LGWAYRPKAAKLIGLAVAAGISADNAMHQLVDVNVSFGELVKGWIACAAS